MGTTCMCHVLMKPVFQWNINWYFGWDINNLSYLMSAMWLKIAKLNATLQLNFVIQ